MINKNKKLDATILRGDFREFNKVFPNNEKIDGNTKFIKNPNNLYSEQKLLPIAHHIEDENYSIWNGFRFDRKYELKYKMMKTGRVISLGKYSGKELVQRTTHVYETALEDAFKERVDEMGLDYFVRKMTQMIVGAYALSILDKKRFKEIQKDPESHDLSLITKSHKNNYKGRMAKDFVVDNICAHLVCNADICRDKNGEVWDITTLTDTYGVEDYGYDDLSTLDAEREEVIMSMLHFQKREELKNHIVNEGVIEVSGERLAA